MYLAYDPDVYKRVQENAAKLQDRGEIPNKTDAQYCAGLEMGIKFALSEVIDHYFDYGRMGDALDRHHPVEDNSVYRCACGYAAATTSNLKEHILDTMYETATQYA